ncbi:hypothetical protein H8E52_02550 [bacterium]|nr:hypothetical protein [bacterium]
MKIRKLAAVFCVLTFAMVGVANADTYGNTTPFEAMSSHSPNYVLGVQVVVPIAFELQSFGMMYGHEEFGAPLADNAIFGLYSTDVTNGYPMDLMAVTGAHYLDSVAIYDNLAFTSTPIIPAGTYWMMALYETGANPRMGLLDSSSLVAYWSNSYGAGMPASAPAVSTYLGQNFNYWINGVPGGTSTVESTWSGVKSLY